MTNFVKQKFQWFFDMATSTDGLQLMNIQAGGPDVQKRLAPFFGAFKYFKLGKINIRMVPAATLPVDPTGLSYEAGEQTVDPRDMFNPGLVRITNGEDMPWDGTGASTLNQDQYYAMMLDKRWYKFRLQNGFKRSAKPLAWQVAQIMQDEYPGTTTNYPFFQHVSGTSSAKVGVVSFKESDTDTYGVDGYNDPDEYALGQYSSGRGLFQTGKNISMGWMPTDYFQQVYNPNLGGLQDDWGAHAIPTIPVITVVLPQAYKTKFYYRVYVEETVMFKDAVAINPVVDAGVNTKYIQPADRYIGAKLQKVGSGNTISSVTDVSSQNDGGLHK